MTKTIEGRLDTVEIMPATQEDEIIQNVKTIVSTTLGESPMCRNIGVNPVSKHSMQTVAKVLLTRDIFTAVQDQETRAEVTNVDFATTDTWGGIAPLMEVKINGG